MTDVKRLIPTLSGVASALAVGGGLMLGRRALLVVLLVLVVAIASGWPALLSLPTKRGSTSTIAVTGALAVLIVSLGRTDPLKWLPAVLGLSMVVVFFHQILRRDERPRLIESVTGVVGGVVVAHLASHWMILERTDHEAIAFVGLASVVAALVTTALPGHRVWRWAVVPVAGAVSAAVGYVQSGSLLWPSLGLGALVALVALVVDTVLGRLPKAASGPASVSVGASVVACCGALVAMWSQFL